MVSACLVKGKKSFLAESFFKLKLSKAVMDCKQMIKYVVKNSDLTKDDNKYNLLVASEDGKKISEKYFLFKGSHLDGRLKEIKKFDISGDNIEFVKEKMKLHIVAYDIFSKNIFMYDCKREENYVTGYTIKKIRHKNSEIITFLVTKERSKIHVKNINKRTEFYDIESLICQYGY